MASTALSQSEITEICDSDEKIQANIKKLADLIRNSKHCVIYTGAGISTAAGIPDFRGPEGVWTLRAKGMKAEVKKHVKMPTLTHMAVKKLIDDGLVKYLVSQNIDGLHVRSGVSFEKIAELHGNSFKEYCKKCKKVFLRDFHTRNNIKVHDHSTGRKCICGGDFYDTIINFGESLPVLELENSEQESKKCDLAIVLGTSMRVMPACELPMMRLKNTPMAIVNLQATPYDNKCDVRIHAKTDKVMELLMHELGIQIPDFIYEFSFKITFVNNRVKISEATGQFDALINSIKLYNSANKEFKIAKAGETVIEKVSKDDNFKLKLSYNLMNPMKDNSFIELKNNSKVSIKLNTFDGTFTYNLS